MTFVKILRYIFWGPLVIFDIFYRDMVKRIWENLFTVLDSHLFDVVVQGNGDLSVLGRGHISPDHADRSVLTAK